jgi:hypothetical protein
VTLGELIDKVQAVLDVGAADAFTVAQELWTTEDRDYTEAQIRYAGTKLGVVAEKASSGEQAVAQHHEEMLTDPAEILAEVARVMPRVMVEAMPRIGRRPKDHELSAQLEDLLADAPDHVRALICDVDLFNGAATFTLYDEANDVDRSVGPIDLRRYESGREMWHAFEVLLGRLPKVLAADHN